jgi:protein-S-isoprenylcysteine O-methyltransferase Ste14
MQRWRVPLGFACAALFFLLAKPGWWSLLIGALIALPGLALRAWATGHLKKNEALAISGPYAYTRNPLYLGSFLIGLGFTVAAGRWILIIVFAAMMLGIYLPVMRVESETLAGLFGDKYQRYARSVPLILPRLSPYKPADIERTNFDAKLYRRYREYRASLGVVVAWAVLALKALFLR